MPAWFFVLMSRVSALFGKRRWDQEFDAEIGAHLDALTDEYMRRGYPADEARRAALLRFGGPMQTIEEHREHRTLPFIETSIQDVRYAVRSLRRNPAFSLVAIVTLAIGIAAGTTVFTFVRAVLLRPLPYRNPGELVRVYETNPLRNWTKNIASPANWADWRTRNSVFTDIAAYEQFNPQGSGASDIFLTGNGEPQALKAIGVSGNLFTVLGTTPLLGRVFTDDEMYDGKARVAILSYGLWRSAFGADQAIIGRSITLSGRSYDVVGVMPPTFFFPGRDVQIWTPFGYTRERIAQSRRPHYLGVVARLKPGVTIERARQDMNAIATQLEQQYPDTNTRMGVRLDMLHDSFASEPRGGLLMLSGAVALLFLIVCANIANLQLGRAVSRERELSVRRALGAARTRILRQLLTESLVLSIAGGALGIAAVFLAQSGLTRFAASAVPRFAEVTVDRSVLQFAIAISIGAPILFGIMPALLSSRREHISDRTASGTREAGILRNTLVAAEVALAIVLSVGAVLLIRSLDRLQNVDPGFAPSHAVAFTLSLPGARYPDAAARFNAFSEIERRLKEMPGVNAVGATSTLALKGFTWSGDTTIEGRPATDYERDTRHGSTTVDYFAAMGIRLLAGRPFSTADTRQTPQVTVVNETFARRYYRGLPLEQVVGKRITFGRPPDNAPWVQIVGVVADEKQDGLDRPAEPIAYSSVSQRQQNPLTFVVRSKETTQPLDAVIADARAAVNAFDKDLALTDVTTLDDLVERATEGHRFRTALLTGFATVALFLAALGIYGVLAYSVSQRSRELGIRLALGAKPAELFAHVVTQGLRPVAIGAVVGVVGAIGLTSVMQSLLFGVTPLDVPTYAVATVTLAAIAVIACALPALRAMRVDPLVALRQD